VKIKARSFNRYVADTITLHRTLKAAEQEEENIIREVILPYLDRQIARAEKKVPIQERS
jgi:hypothetical protein